MSKIKRITVSNLKAVSNQTADFNGMTAIITGGNNKGKTTFLRTLFDRIRGTKPDLILKQGEHEGFAECELTTGEKLKWQFDDKTKAGEKLSFVTTDNFKMPLSRAIADKYFPATFDVDKFLNATPSAQRKTLQELVGLDFTDIDKRYKEAYDNRTLVNRAAREEDIKFESLTVAEKVEVVSLDEFIKQKEEVRAELNKKYLENKKINDDARKLWQQSCDNERAKVSQHNIIQSRIKTEIVVIELALDTLNKNGYTGNEVSEFIKQKKSSVMEDLVYQPPPEPTYISELPDNAPLLTIENQINDANETNRKAQLYNNWLTAKQQKEDAGKRSIEAENKVEAIEKERMDLIKSAKMPEGFSFTDDGITYNGLSFTREQLSSSGIYIAALKLAAMTLGDVKTLHFDASFLDKNSLPDIEKWANENDLQLLIERPDFEGGEITYELIQKV